MGELSRLEGGVGGACFDAALFVWMWAVVVFGGGGRWSWSRWWWSRWVGWVGQSKGEAVAPAKQEATRRPGSCMYHPPCVTNKLNQHASRVRVHARLQRPCSPPHKAPPSMHRKPALKKILIIRISWYHCSPPQLPPHPIPAIRSSLHPLRRLMPKNQYREHLRILLV